MLSKKSQLQKETKVCKHETKHKARFVLLYLEQINIKHSVKLCEPKQGRINFYVIWFKIKTFKTKKKLAYEQNNI